MLHQDRWTSGWEKDEQVMSHGETKGSTKSLLQRLLGVLSRNYAAGGCGCIFMSWRVYRRLSAERTPGDGKKAGLVGLARRCGKGEGWAFNITVVRLA